MRSIDTPTGALIISLGIVAAGAHAGECETVEAFEFSPSDVAGESSFGASVTITDGVIVVGAPFDDTTVEDSGSAYLYTPSAAFPTIKLVPDDPIEDLRAGWAVATSQGRVVLGCFQQTHVFVFDIETGDQTAALTGSDTLGNDRFGYSLAVDGDTLVVGAYLDSTPQTQDMIGSVYIFDLATNQEVFKINSFDGFDGDQFGRSVAVGGGVAVVGAPMDDDMGLQSGSAYLYDVETGAMIHKLLAPDGLQTDNFGEAVAISGNLVAVSAPSANAPGPNSGAAYVFDATTGAMISKLVSDDIADFDTFGRSIGISGQLVVVGASEDDDDGNQSGSAYVFNALTGEQLAKITASDAMVGDAFGSASAIADGLIVVGAPSAGPNFLGAAYLYATCEADCGPGAGPCAVPNGTPGCDEVECCSIVCANDPSCCEVAWDQACADTAVIDCALPPIICPGDGNCQQPNGTPGCDDGACCTLICAADPSCCQVEWDQLCADAAVACLPPPACPGDGDCFDPKGNGTPGCADEECCFTVCAIDPGCCESEWDDDCAEVAGFLCQPIVCPGEGDCCTDNGTPGCDDPECCETVCAIDPFCCVLAWDAPCAAISDDLCEPCQEPTFWSKEHFHPATISDDVLHTALYDGGAGAEVYVGGSFGTVAGLPIQGIARWNGAAWRELGDGIKGAVRAMTPFNDGAGERLFAVTSHSGVGVLRAWDGFSWEEIPTGAGVTGLKDTSAMAVFPGTDGPALIIAGGDDLNFPGGSVAIGAYDGEAWSGLGSGIEGSVFALCVGDLGQGPRLFAVGKFTAAGGTPASSIAAWDGVAWTEVGGGAFDERAGEAFINAVAVFDDGSGPQLYISGTFAQVGDTAASILARWDGEAWEDLSAPFANPNPPLALHASNVGGSPSLVLGGNFELDLDDNGSTDVRRLAVFDGDAFDALQPGSCDAGQCAPSPNATVWTFTSGTFAGVPTLVIGGDFIGEIGQRAWTWDGQELCGLGSGVGPGVPPVADLYVDHEVDPPLLYVTGGFPQIGGKAHRGVATWDGTGWTPIGPPLDGQPRAVALFDDGAGPRVYVAGAALSPVDSAGGQAPASILRLADSGLWEVVGDLNGTAYALEVFDDGAGPALFAGGSFGPGPGRLVRWNGRTWDVAGDGLLGNEVRALAVWDDGFGPALYAGGNFISVTPGEFANLARWNGAALTGLPAGEPNGFVYALLPYDDGADAFLAVGGEFFQAGVVPVTAMAKFQNGAWSPIGALEEAQLSSVTAFAQHDDGLGVRLYASGSAVGFPEAAGMARWNGLEWMQLPGFTSPAEAMAGVQHAEAGVNDLIVAADHAFESGGGTLGLSVWQGLPIDPCPADLTDDGVVDSADLNVLLGAFGTGAAGDINLDGVTNSTDLNLLLARFGAACID